MGAKICTPSPEKLENQQIHRNLESLVQKIELPQDFDHNSDMDEYGDEDQNYYDNIDLNLPDYEKQLLSKKYPFFEKIDQKEYTRILGKYLVRIQGWDQPITSKVVHTKRVMTQFKILEKTLPCESSNSIFVVINEKDMSQMQCIIFGSQGTPYQHGAFLYTINLLDTYPNQPPKVNLQTTGGHRVRFNPNLYESGYVCLSLLGTWTGQPKENWQPNQSNISQILLSIQTIVMNEDVYYNEPSYEDSDRISCHGYNIAYQNIVKFGNITYAMNQMLENPPAIFKKIIKTHFYLKRNKILQSVYQWIQDNNVAQYGDLVQQHNYLFCNRYTRPWLYKNDLITELQRLYSNLSKIQLADTYFVQQKKQQQIANLDQESTQLIEQPKQIQTLEEQQVTNQNQIQI